MVMLSFITESHRIAVLLGVCDAVVSKYVREIEAPFLATYRTRL